MDSSQLELLFDTLQMEEQGLRISAAPCCHWKKNPGAISKLS